MTSQVCKRTTAPRQRTTIEDIYFEEIQCQLWRNCLP